jgi:predicted ATPase/DNA-binding SARP family transcriptional activator/Tfp pilus assembly protein PilF
MAHLELALLGGFHAALDDTPITGFEGDKTRALLAYLAIKPAYPHRREALAGLLWPEFSDDAARRNLRYTLFKLRQALGEAEDAPGFLLITPQTVALDPAADVHLDVTAFTDHRAACRAHRHRTPASCTTCHAHFAQMAALYQGELLHGFDLTGCQAFEEWLLLEREGLHRAAVEALGYLAAYHAARAEYTPALAYTYRQLDLEPWREAAHRQAMRLLAVRGDRSAALAQYAACRKALAEELNAEPSAETTALYAQLQTAGAVPLPGAPPAPLPRSPTPLIGREAELRQLLEWLDSPDYPVVTIMGPGGVGKTRLAVEAARQQAGAFQDGVYWVPLAAVGTPDLLAGTIAQAVHLQPGPTEDPAAQLVRYLRDKELLLVLDNFEQLLPGGEATDLLLDILGSAPRLGLLVTSRERLGLHTECLLDLTGLALPPEPPARRRATSRPAAQAAPPSPDELLTASAVQLFVECAQRTSPAFTLSPETAPGVVEICRLVGGLPLGIVLAAAWVRHVPPARIAASIRANLDFLTGSARAAAPQHRSLRAVFQHSWNLLAAEEQRVLRTLSLFRGGWEEEAAAQVAGAALPVLLSLVDKSLLRRDAAGRFDSHEVLRQYAGEQLDAVAAPERAAASRRYAAYFVGLAEEAEGGLKTGEQHRWLQRLEEEHDNLRAVLRWAREQGDVEVGLRLGGALWRFWSMHGYFREGRAHLAAVLEMADAPGPAGAAQEDEPHTVQLTAVKAKAAFGGGALHMSLGDFDTARALFEQSLALSRELGDRPGMAAALNTLGIVAHQQGNYATARELYAQSLALRRALGDQWGIATLLNNLGIMAHYQGDYEAAWALHAESLALRRALEDRRGIASSLENLGHAAHNRGHYEQARALYEESLALTRELADQWGSALLLFRLGNLAQNQADYTTARTLHDESLALRRELGDKQGIAASLNSLAIIAHQAGDGAAAQALAEESLRLRRELGDKWGIAGTLNTLGLVAHSRGEDAAAQALYTESLALRRELGDRRGMAGSLAGLGGLVAGRAAREGQAGDAEQAARLFGAVEGLLERIGGVLDIEDREPYARHGADLRTILGPEALARAWAAGRAWSLEHALRQVLPE